MNDIMPKGCPSRHIPGKDKWEIRGGQYRHCSYCGSIHPEDLFLAIVNKEKLTPTDKNYKVYVGNYKFYFYHLTTEQMDYFIKLYNEKLIDMNSPGYFYVKPYFVA